MITNFLRICKDFGFYKNILKYLDKRFNLKFLVKGELGDIDEGNKDFDK